MSITNTINIYHLIFEEAILLHEYDPSNELLKYISSDRSDVVWNEFMTRFGHTSKDMSFNITKAYNNYYLALHQEVKKKKMQSNIIIHDDADSY